MLSTEVRPFVWLVADEWGDGCPRCGYTGEEWLMVSGGDGWSGKPCPHCSPKAQMEAGYYAYFDRKGPGRGWERSLGWLKAYHEEQTELAERAQDRQGRYNVAYGLL